MNKIHFFFNKFPLGLFFLLIFFFNFHAIIKEYLFFYKEILSIIFVVLSILYFFYFKLNFVDLIFKNKIYIFLFSYLFLFLIFIFNIGPIDPEFSKSSTILNNDTDKNFLLLYTIRNFIVLIPVVIFFSLRGLSEKEIKNILLFVVFVGLIGFLVQIIYQVNLKKISLYHYFYNYNYFAFNNTYMAFISSIYAFGLYLVIKEKNKLNSAILIIIISLIFFMIFLSSSKAAILFCLISFIFFSIVFFKKKKKLLFLFIGKIIILSFCNFSINQYHKFNKSNLFNKNNLDKYDYYQMNKDYFTYPLFNPDIGRKDINSRLDAYKSFFIYLKKLSLYDYKFYFGTGSLSSTFSGYHNDYMRIFYRAGFFGLLFSFIPFFYFFYKFLILSINRLFFNKKNIKTDFVYLLTLLLGFNLYYSLFAYPREDVYQSSTIWIVLILMYGYLNKKNI